jgi:two-component system, LytTR family, sensor kinase
MHAAAAAHPAPHFAPRAEREGRAFLGLGPSTWAAVVGFWTMIALLDGAKTYLSPNHPTDPRNVARMLFETFQWWYLWIPLTPLVFTLARRFPLGAEKGGRNVALHFAFAIPVSLAHTVAGAMVFWMAVASPLRGAPLEATLIPMIKMFLISGIVVYWTMVVTSSALDFHRRMRDRELEAARLAVRAAQLETSVTEARLSALRMELNPHFLFNSLNSVAGLVRRREHDKAVQVLATLGELLRVTLGQKEQEVPLEMEMDFLRRYLEIERVRYVDRLTVEEDVPAALLPLPVPSLVLQPLVENAVRYGVARQRGPGTVRIGARREGDQLVLEVADSGPGPDGTVRGTGVGLANTRERLAQLYGDRASFRLERAPGGGTRAVVRIPVPADPNAFSNS